MDLHYSFTTAAAPVQAEGTVDGHRFHFRSRHEEWTFAVSERPDVDPAELETNGSDDRGWVGTGRFAERFRASTLDASEAEAIIRACAAAYIAERAR